MRLGMDPWTGSQDTCAGGNPVSGIEIDGHDFWSDLGDVGSGRLDEMANYIPDKIDSISAFIDDPRGHPSR